MKYIICLFSFFIYQSAVLAQPKGSIKTLYGRVISIDSPQVERLNGNDLVNTGQYRYYYSIFHFKVVNPQNDTITLGFVYSLFQDVEKLRNNFGIQKDSIYIYHVSEFHPCYSDFPGFYNCSYPKRKKYGQIIPTKGQVVGTPYSKIDRVLYYTNLDKNLWNQLIDK